MLLACSFVGCGGSSTGARAALAAEATPRPPSVTAAARDWVWVSAPLWSSQVFPVPTGDATTDACITTGSIRACAMDNEWRDVTLGTHAQDVLFAAGRAGDDWIFEHKNGGVFASRGFTGVLRELDVQAGSTSLGEPWHPPTRLTREGALLRWSGSSFAVLPFPGRVYDAAFSPQGAGIVLAEPGVVYTSDAGERWAPVQHAGVAPRTVAAVDPTALSMALATVVQQAMPASERVYQVDDDVMRSWLRWLLHRFNGRNTITLPDLVPEVWNSARRLGVLGDLAEAPWGDLIPLAAGWLGFDHNDEGEAAFHVSESLQVRRVGMGSDDTLIASHDGAATLAFGVDCDGEETEGPGADACLTDASGSRSLRVPAGILCADIVALGDGQLLVGGDDCPAEVCAEHPLVRIDLSPGPMRLRRVPVPIEGEAPAFSRAAPEDCVDWVRDASSASIPDGQQVRLGVVTAAGPRLLVGPVDGTLRSLPLPATPTEERMAFADADHGVIAEPARVWTTTDGGSTWESPTSAPSADAHVPELAELPQCSPDACRVGDYYWMPAHLAERAGFERRMPAGVLRRRRDESNPAPRDTLAPWRQAPLTRPSLTPTPTLRPLRSTEHVPWRGALFRVVGGVVETAPRDSAHAGAIEWYGVTPEATHFRVSTTAGSPSQPLDFGDHDALAATERFAVILRANWYASRDSALVVVRGDGRTTHHPVPFARDQLATPDRRAIWPLPLPDGGLGLYFFADGTRWMLRFSRDGDMVAERIVVGLPELRDEALAWVDGELGVAITQADGVARFYAVSGIDRDVTAPRTPEGPCGRAESRTASRFVGSWGDVRMGRRAVAVAQSWSMSEEHDGRACLRATAPVWSPSDDARQGHGTQLVVATGDGFRGWFISHDGTLEWPVVFPGRHDPYAGESSQNVALVREEIELAVTPLGFQLWLQNGSAAASFRFPAGLYAYLWSDVRPEGSWRHAAAAMPDERLRLRPGVLTSSWVAHRFSGPDTIQHAAQPARDGSVYLDAVANERGMASAVRSNEGIDVEWWGADNERHHMTLPATGPVYGWQSARFTPDAEHLFLLRVRRPHAQQATSMIELNLIHLGQGGEFLQGPTLQLPRDQLGRFAVAHTASARGKVVVGLSGLQSDPIHVWSAGRTGRLRRLGHPIATSQCGASVLTLGADPPLVVWTDCAVGTLSRYLRVARLAGNQWREVLPARTLHSVDAVAAFVDDTRGLHVVTLENDVAVVMTPGRTDWEVVGRFGRLPRTH